MRKNNKKKKKDVIEREGQIGSECLFWDNMTVTVKTSNI